ncbi:MAG: 50S ribosomal protein L2 [Chloroflexi bacterium]|nr:50S ribosomal protein L2 [Chloroflexota bacterium]
MALIRSKPTTPGERGRVRLSSDDLTVSKPKKSLVKAKPQRAGRAANGRISVRRRGGGAKRQYRVIDFKRDKKDVPGQIASIEYDPNRSCRIALVKYADGDWRYILGPEGLGVGDMIVAGDSVEPRTGNALPLRAMPTGTLVHNVELQLGKGGQIVRSAGAAAQVLAKEGGYTLLRLPSGETRQVLDTCMATVGQVGNLDHKNVKLGKAGRSGHLGRRPHVRGVAMNPNDHPHGGGEGRSPIGMPGPKTPWGKPTLGYRTRKNKRSNTFIVRRRHKK